MRVPELQPAGSDQRRSALARLRPLLRHCGTGLLTAAVLFAPVARAADRQAPVWTRVRLTGIGFPGVSSSFLNAGASMLTTHFIDNTHMLVTFGTRGLVQRVDKDPADHDDRMVAAEIVELPTGKVLARTDWHMHDHGRYIWPLGHGRFLIRIGDDISVIDPLANLATHDPFQRLAFPRQQSRPTLVVVSPDNGIVTIETKVRLGAKSASWGDTPEADLGQGATLIEFFRAQKDQATGYVRAGTVLAPQPLFLPINADGTLWATQAGRNRWHIVFDRFGGGTVHAGEIMSSCDPQLQMVSRSEYVTITCSGLDDHKKLTAYALDGHEAWEEPMGGLDDPVYRFAIGSGRFAMERVTESTRLNDALGGAPDTYSSQEVRVYQIESGDLLLKAQCTPQIKTAENFDLSEDGSLAAVVTNGDLVIYKLPPPEKQDLRDIAEVEKLAPPATLAPVTLTRITNIAKAEPPVKGPATAPPAPAAKQAAAEIAADKSTTTGPIPEAVADSQAKLAAAEAAHPANVPAIAASPSASANDRALAAAAQQEGVPRRRQPPTLLNPGEKPEFGKANPQPTDIPQNPDR